MRKRYILLFFLVGLAFLALIYGAIGIREVASQISVADRGLILGALVSFVISISAWTVRWDTYISRAGYSVRFHNTISYLLTGIAVNNFTPIAKVGGEPLRAYLLQEREGIPMDIGMATTMVEMVTDISVSLPLSFLAILTAALFFPVTPMETAGMFLIALLTAVVFGAIVGFASSESLLLRTTDWISERVRFLKPYKDRIHRNMREFRDNFRDALSDKKAFGLAASAALLQKGFDALRLYLVLLALGIGLNFVQIFVLLGVYLLLFAVPSPPGGLGVMEGGSVGVLVLLGVPVGIAGAAVLLERAISYWLPTVVGIILGSYFGISIWQELEDGRSQ